MYIFHKLLTDLFGSCVIAAAFSYYYEDPGGLIPSWIINWAAKVF